MISFWLLFCLLENLMILSSIVSSSSMKRGMIENPSGELLDSEWSFVPYNNPSWVNLGNNFIKLINSQGMSTAISNETLKPITAGNSVSKNPIESIAVTFKDQYGHCPMETVYEITSLQQLKGYIGELECIYARGTAPEIPPVGIWHGEVIQVVNTELFNPFASTLWSGKLSFKTQCDVKSSEFYMLVNFVGNGPKFPAYVYVGKLKDPLAAGEPTDDKDHLIVDYTVNFSHICPAPEGSSKQVTFGILNDEFPLNQLVDLVRIVGQTSDGGYIYLGKTLIRHAYEFPDVGDTTIGYWAVVIYDEVVPERNEWILRELPQSFDWKLKSTVSELSYVNPVEAAVNDPFNMLLKSVHYMVKQPLGIPPVYEPIKSTEQEYTLAGIPNDDQFDIQYSSEENKSSTNIKDILSGRIN